MNTTKTIQQRINIFPKMVILLLTAYCLLLASCTDTDKFYTQLVEQPEVIADLETVYFIDDTLTIRGRLNPENNLEIYIGGVKAKIEELAVEAVQGNRNGLTLDVAKVVISEAMGVGENRPVAVVSAGISVDMPVIEIVSDKDDGVSIIDKQLQLVKIADIPTGAVPVYCRSGSGNVYVWQNTGKKLFKIDAADGSVTQVLDESKLTDDRGAYTIDEFNSGAVSPDEQYFYFSAKVRYGTPRTLEYYKLVRYDLQTGIAETLNHTDYSIFPDRRTLEAARPFEGNIYDADPDERPKMYKITAIWPDAQGNVYFNLMGHFLTKLDKDNNYSYLINMNSSTNQSQKPATESVFVPLIFNPVTEVYYSSLWIHRLFPGTPVSSYGVSYLDTEADIIYHENLSGSTRYLIVADLLTLAQIGRYSGTSGSFSGDRKFVSASLKWFNGGIFNFNGISHLPVNGKYVGICFQTIVNSNIVTGGILCEIDFENELSRRYSKDELLFNEFTLSGQYDRLLDVDAEGMLYMTANKGTVLLKTTYVD